MANILQLQVGDSLVQTEWEKVTQEMINTFADATGDHQWIHLDESKCEQFSPFGCTIAHGFLTASLMPKAFGTCVETTDKVASVINYGMNKLRFLEPVRVNRHIRYQFTVVSIEDKPMGRLITVSGECMLKEEDKPALVGEFLTLVIPA